MSHRSRTDAASASLELVILAPVLITLMGLMYAFGVYAQTEAVVDQAARDAVRAATQSRSADEARATSESAAASTLEDAVADCLDSSISLRTTTGDFEASSPLEDEMNMAYVEVTCTVDLSAVTFLPFLGRTTLDSTFVSPLDTYRGYY